jgi:hypothetical protein
VSSADVVLLKEAQSRYAGREFEELYEKWHQGAISDSEVMRDAERDYPAGRLVFRVMVCGSSLTVFTDPRGNATESYAENESSAV